MSHPLQEPALLELSEHRLLLQVTESKSHQNAARFLLPFGALPALFPFVPSLLFRDLRLLLALLSCLAQDRSPGDTEDPGSRIRACSPRATQRDSLVASMLAQEGATADGQSASTPVSSPVSSPVQGEVWNTVACGSGASLYHHTHG